MERHNFNTTQHTLHIKNMVSASCVRIIKESLQRTGFIEVTRIELGEADVRFDPNIISLEFIDQLLKKDGFELIHDHTKRLVEKIKTAVIQLVFYGNNTNSLIRNSDYLSERLGHPYPYLSKLFSERTGTTLEKYIILIKVEKIKELISYDELTLSEIAFQMGYSSVQYLSNQFKQVTGVTVSEYKNQLHERKPLSRLLD
jgi:AraC family transcriptional regulator